MKVLSGHTNSETAYVVDDYPYGFRLRCKIRYWLEYKKGYGYRLVSQTTNPKVSGEVWNKPKASTYATLGVMFLNEENHVTWTGMGFFSSSEKMLEFKTTYSEGLDDEGKKTLEALIQRATAYEKRMSQKEVL